MREKLLILMKSEGLTASRLAELLGIGASGISHILGGRNKPKLDFIEKLLRRFPRINPDWLLLDSDQMFRDTQPSLLSLELSAQAEESGIDVSTSEPSRGMSDGTLRANQDAQNSHISTNAPIAEKISYSSKAIKRVIILYADHTFESYEG